MKLGVYQTALAPSACLADTVIWYEPVGLDWSVTNAIGDVAGQSVMNDVDAIVAFIKETAKPSDVVVVMSNGSFGGIYGKLITALS